MLSDEKVLLPEKKSLFKNQPKKKRRKIDAINYFVLFHWKEILIVFYN